MRRFVGLAASAAVLIGIAMILLDGTESDPEPSVFAIVAVGLLVAGTLVGVILGAISTLRAVFYAIRDGFRSGGGPPSA